MRKEVDLNGACIEDKIWVEEDVFVKCSNCGKELRVDINLEYTTVGKEYRSIAHAYCDICDKEYEFPAILYAKLDIDFGDLKESEDIA